MPDERDPLDDRILNVLEGIIESEHVFMNPQSLRLIPYGERYRILERYLNNHSVMLQTITRIFAYSNNLTNAAAAILTYTLPTRGNTFLDPVIVAPTENQITDAIVV